MKKLVLFLAILASSGTFTFLLALGNLPIPKPYLTMIALTPFTTILITLATLGFILILKMTTRTLILGLILLLLAWLGMETMLLYSWPSERNP